MKDIVARVRGFVAKHSSKFVLGVGGVFAFTAVIMFATTMGSSPIDVVNTQTADMTELNETLEKIDGNLEDQVAVAQVNSTSAVQPKSEISAPEDQVSAASENAVSEQAVNGQAASEQAKTTASTTPKATTSGATGTVDALQNAIPTATVNPDAFEEKVMPYQIYVSKNSYTIAILKPDENNEYTQLVRKFSTGIGRSSAQTRAGSYTITSKERWHAWGGGGYSPYASKHSGGLWFHGAIYSSKDSNSMQPGSYNAIGTACSSGCLRTTASAASWIYYNCPIGTPVVIANDSKYSASAPADIPSTQRYDPTDPGADQEIPVTSFNISKTSATLEVGDAVTISVSGVQPSDTNTKDFIYKSSDESVATVDSSGKVTAISPGTTTISVTADDVGEETKKCTVTVNEPIPEETPEPGSTPETTPENTTDPDASASPSPTTTATPTATKDPITATPQPTTATSSGFDFKPID